MIYIDQKITTWERFEINDEHKDALFEYMKENPSFTSLDLYDWAHEQGYDPHSEIIEGAEETIDPYENNEESTIQILQDDPDNLLDGMITLWDNTPPLQDDRNAKPQPVGIPAEKPEKPVETEYRFLNIGEIIEEGDQYYVWGSNNWCETEHNKHCPSKVIIANFYRRKVEPVETEYRFLKEGELIREGDELYGNGKWSSTNYSSSWISTAARSNVYRRKDERIQECSCGRIRINHHTLGWICEDCEWQGEPY